MNVGKHNWLWRRRCQQLDADEQAAALTEFAIMLPIFLLVMTALMQLGHLGQSTVAVKTTAYSQMWEKSYEKTDSSIDEKPEVYTPRDDLLDALPDDLDAQEVVASADAAATGAGGHWGEALMRTQMAPFLSGFQVGPGYNNTDAANRLHSNLNLTNPSSTMDTIIGEDRDTRTSFAVNDNIIDDNIGDHVTDMQDGSSVASGLVGAMTQASGAVPSLFAGVRHGEGQGSAKAEIEYSNRFLPHEYTYTASYATSLSPAAGEDGAIPGVDGLEFGSLGREQQQYAFYYLTGQSVDNKRNMLDVLDLGLEGSPRTFGEVERYE